MISIKRLFNYKFILIAIFLTWLTGCVSSRDIKNDRSPDAAHAEHLVQQGEFGLAAQEFLALADEHSKERAYYRLRAAEALRENGNLDTVAEVLKQIKRRHLSEEEDVRINLLQAEIALAHHDIAQALSWLNSPEKHFPAHLRIRALELRARGLTENGDVMTGVRTRLTLNQLLSGTDRTQNEAQIIETLQKFTPEELKTEASAFSDSDPLHPWLERALRKKGRALPQTVLRPDRPVGTQLPDQNMQREGFQPIRHVALLLPSDNSLKSIAQSIRDGFFTAHTADQNEIRPEIRVYDVGPQPEDAISVYQQAVSDGAERVVGPLTRAAVAALFAQQTLPVPVLALNHPDSGEPPPPGSAEFGLLPDAEAVQVAEYMHERDIQRAVVIAATDDWAERAALAFRAQFEQAGGSVVGEARVKEGDINFSAMIRQAFAAVPAVKNVRSLAADATVSSTAIFISLRPQQARLLLPQLKIASYNALPVFGTSHIYSGVPNVSLDRDLNGVYFCDSPWLFDTTPGLPKRADIVRTVESARGGGARLFAFGLDAYALLPYLGWLEQHHEVYLPGATGQLAQDASGRIHRLLTWAQFTDGLAHPVNELTLNPVE